MKKILLFLLTPVCVQAQTISTVAGTVTVGYCCDGGLATNAEIDYPVNIVGDHAGNIYLADQTNYRIRKITLGDTITTIAGNGTQSVTGDNGPAIDATIGFPSGFAIDDSGNLYISQSTQAVIRKISASGIITTIAGAGVSGNTGNGGPVMAAQINPSALAVDHAGNIYFADNDRFIIRKIDVSGIVTIFAGVNGSIGFDGDGGPATSAEINPPASMIFDAANNMYFAQYYDSVIRQITPDGNISSVLHHVPATNLAFDGAGDIIYSSSLINKVSKISMSGIITPIAGTGVLGFSGDNGPAISAKLSQPLNLVVNAVTGNIFIADRSNHRIRKVDVPPTGVNAVPSPAKYTISPNPVRNELSITAPTKINKVEIINTLGQSISLGHYSSANVSINTSNLKAGLYFVKINDEIIEKIVVD